jgi:hypothetical protein
MSIDGVGKPPGGSPGIGGAGGAGGVGGVGESGESFSVGKPESVAPAEGSDALGRLQRGEIDLDQYLDTRVETAIQHLEGRLPAEQIEFVKTTLREQLAADPVLSELVRRATGAAGGAGDW